MVNPTTLITGADGYVGRNVVSALLDGTDDELLLCVRARTAVDLADKRSAIERHLARPLPDRASLVGMDLHDHDPLNRVDHRRITRIVHTAATTDLAVNRDIANKINVAGTVKVCAFAAKCENLGRLALISSVYAAGRHEGYIREAPLDDAGFANEYERSKWAAEARALAMCDGLPLSILRLPLIVADDPSGKVVQVNAFHSTLRMFYRGLLSLMPGNPKNRLAIASMSFVVAAVSQLLEPRARDGIYHLCGDPDQALAIAEIIDVAFAVFAQDPTFRRRGHLRPPFCDEESFMELVSAATALRASRLGRGIGYVAPFAGQLYAPKDFANDALRAVWQAYAPEDPRALVESTVASLVTDRWRGGQRGT